MTSLRNADKEINRLFEPYKSRSQYSGSDIFDQGISPNVGLKNSKKLKNVLYSVKDDANLMSYVSRTVQKAKNEVTTSIRDLKNLENFKKQKFDFVQNTNTELHLGMRRLMQDVLNDLEIDALAFGVKNGIGKYRPEFENIPRNGLQMSPNAKKNRFLDFLKNYESQNQDQNAANMSKSKKLHKERI